MKKFYFQKKQTNKKIVCLNLKTHFLLIKTQNKKINNRTEKKIVCLYLK